MSSTMIIPIAKARKVSPANFARVGPNPGVRALVYLHVIFLRKIFSASLTLVAEGATDESDLINSSNDEY